MTSTIAGHYELYCCYHARVWPGRYGAEIGRVTFVKLGDCHSDFRPLRSLDIREFSTFVPLGRHFAEYELLLNLYWAWRAGEFELPEFVGVIHYDMEFECGGRPITQLLDELPRSPRTGAAFFRLAYEQVVRDDVKLPMPDGTECDWVHRTLLEHNRRREVPLAERDLAGRTFPMCTAMLAPWAAVAEAVAGLDLTYRSGFYHTLDEGNRIAGGMMERQFAMGMAVQDLDWHTFPLPHHFLTCYGADQR